MNEQVRPFGILSVDYLGNYSTFSPELIGQNNLNYNNFIFGNALNEQNNLKFFLDNKHLIKAFHSIQLGVNKCAKTCEYFGYCGGGSPSNKFYENDSFASGETFHCRSMIQEPFNVVLEALEKSKNL